MYPVLLLYGKLMGKKVETMTDLIFLGCRITVDGDCGHEIKRHTLFGRIAMTNLVSTLKTKDITLLTKVHIAKLWFFQLSCLNVRVQL